MFIVRYLLMFEKYFCPLGKRIKLLLARFVAYTGVSICANKYIPLQHERFD